MTSSRLINVLKPTFQFHEEALTFLIVCESDKERKDLAAALIEKEERFQINVHITKQLPLSKKKQQVGCHFDFIVFVIDLKQKRHSLNSIKDSLTYVDVEYFLGKSCFVVLHDNSGSYDSSLEIVELEQMYRTPALYVDFSSEGEVQYTATKILTIAKNSISLQD